MTTSNINPLMGVPPDGRSSIIRVDEGQRQAALARLLSDGGRPDSTGAERFADYAKANRIDLSRMWAVADQRGKLSASVLAVPNAGRTIMIFASRPGRRNMVPVVGELLRHVNDALRGEDAVLSQALVEPRAEFEIESFTAGHFQRLALLHYLERPLPFVVPDKVPAGWPDDVTIEPYSDSAEQDFLDALDASYVETRDCPELCGLRPTSDILAGHRSTGEFDSALWTLVRQHGRPSGVLLLNPSPAQQTIELVYLGVAPWLRGYGLGSRLMRHAAELVAGRCERAIALAVDSRNEPARRLYAGHGFRQIFQRIAFISRLDERTPVDG